MCANTQKMVYFKLPLIAFIKYRKTNCISISTTLSTYWVSLVVQMVKHLPEMQETQSIPGSERSPGEWNGNSLQYSCLEKSMDRRACWATVHRVAKSQMGLNN